MSFCAQNTEKKNGKRQYLWISQERMKRTLLSSFIYLFFFFLNMTFPLTLIKVSLNPKFGKLLIEREFAYWAYSFSGCKENHCNNVSSKLIVKFNFVLPLQKLAIDALLRNESPHTNDFYLIIE